MRIFGDFFDQKKEFYHIFIDFIDASEENDDLQLRKLINYIKKKNIVYNYEELEHFLQLLINISNNHHRKSGIIYKTLRILFYFKKNIKHTIPNSKLYDIFCNNKLILLHLIKNHTIKIDTYTLDDLINRCEINGVRYLYFFIPEIKETFCDDNIIKYIENKFTDEEINIKIDDEYLENRQKGENDAYICSLIRNDLVEEFISYINHKCIPLNSKIKPSIFETNQFLNENEPNLIQYAAFYGSIQIFRYLAFNNVELNPSLWLYAIHSNNADMIHILEEYEITPHDKTYMKCYEESIKCHHNDIANYLYDFVTLKDKPLFKRKYVEFGFQYHNYLYFPNGFFGNYVFFYMNEYKYFDIVKFYIKSHEDIFENRKILIT